jgi:hypothetical protein
MNKIAYIFHGHSRTWDKCYQNFFKNVHSVLPGDIFIHTWDTKNALNASHWNPNGWVKNLDSHNLEISRQLPDLGGIYNAYKPKVLLVEPNMGIDYSLVPGIVYINQPIELININQSILPACIGTKNMLYQSKRIFTVANSYDEYDYFFSTRMDIDYPTKLTDKEAEAMLNSDSITSPPLSPVDFYDVWCFASKNLMGIKTDYYYHIDNYWFKKTRNFFNYGYERALHQYITDNKIKVRHSNLDYSMIRLF